MLRLFLCSKLSEKKASEESARAEEKARADESKARDAEEKAKVRNYEIIFAQHFVNLAP